MNKGMLCLSVNESSVKNKKKFVNVPEMIQKTIFPNMTDDDRRKSIHVVARRNSRGTLRVHTICPVLKSAKRHKRRIRTNRKAEKLVDAFDIVKCKRTD